MGDVEIIDAKFKKKDCCVCFTTPSEYMCPHCNGQMCSECFNEIMTRSCMCPICREVIESILHNTETTECDRECDRECDE